MVEDLKKLLMNRYKNVIGYSETLKNEIVGGVEVQRKAYRVYVSKKLPKSQLSPQDILPDEINGIPVDVVELGEVKALSSNFQDPTKRYRPIFPGISVGHYLITAGTIGAIVRDKTDGKVCVLSNNHVLGNCLDEETEVLTENGWKRWPDVTEEDKLATLNTKNDEMEYQRPIALHKFWYDGELLHFKSKFLDLMTTPNHRLYAKPTFRSGLPKPIKHLEKYQKFSFVMAEDAYKRMENNPSTSYTMTSFCQWNCMTLESFALPEVKYIKGKDWNIKTPFDARIWVRFLGWYISEGSYAINPNGEYIVSIRNCNLDYIKEIHKLLEDMGFNAFICKGGAGYAVAVNSKQLYTYVSQFGHAGDKFIPKEIKMAPPEILKEFLDAYLKGDGGKNHKYIYACSKSSKLVDDLQEIFTKLGYHSHITKIYGSNYNPSGLYYFITAYRLKEMRITEVSKVKYKGYVYCATVPNGTLLVRRNGKPVWTGNSNKGKTGDAILQPGPYDSGRLPNDQIGTLKRFVEILHNGTNPPPPPPPSTCPVAKTIVSALNHIYSGFGRKTRFQAIVPRAEPENFADCAIADLTVDYSTIPNGLVAPTGIKIDVSPYQTRLIKAGRTTGVTVGTVFDDNATVDVSYGDFTARFVHQIVVTKLSDGDSDHFSQGGDSGSGVYEASVTSSGITSSGLLVGLLFAGSDTHTIVNHIQYVLDGLGVELVT